MSTARKKRNFPKHDSSYKYFFSNKRIFFELMQSFVYEDFVGALREEKCPMLYLINL